MAALSHFPLAGGFVLTLVTAVQPILLRRPPTHWNAGTFIRPIAYALMALILMLDTFPARLGASWANSAGSDGVSQAIVRIAPVS